DGVTYQNCSKQSTDFGVTWKDFSVPRPAHLQPVLLRVNPKDGNNIFASSDLFYRSRDRGNSWRMILNGKGGIGPWQLTRGATDIYTYGENRLFLSHSGIGEWTLQNSPKDFNFWDVQIHPKDPRVIAAAGGITPVGAVKEKSFLLSANGGAT